MEQAIQQAHQAGEAGDVPVGAIIVDRKGNLIATAANRKHRDRDPTAHAEILAIRAASQIKQNWCLKDCDVCWSNHSCQNKAISLWC